MGGRCFFIGHRDTPESIFLQLLSAVERHIVEYGVTEFLVGGYGSFDALAASAVRQLKHKYINIQLVKLLPYYAPHRSATGMAQFDGSLYPDGMEKVPKRLAIIRANRYAVDSSQYMIAYVRRFGNSRNILEYAQKRLLIENLAET